jgi:hypothetical protein
MALYSLVIQEMEVIHLLGPDNRNVTLQRLDGPRRCIPSHLWHVEAEVVRDYKPHFIFFVTFFSSFLGGFEVSTRQIKAFWDLYSSLSLCVYMWRSPYPEDLSGDKFSFFLFFSIHANSIGKFFKSLVFIKRFINFTVLREVISPN